MVDYGYLRFQQISFKDVGARLSTPYCIRHYSVTETNSESSENLHLYLRPFASFLLSPKLITPNSTGQF